MSSFQPAIPISGLLCQRKLRSGSALVGLLELPSSFIPVEGVAYALVMEGEAVRVLPQALDEGLEKHPATQEKALGIGDILVKPVWPTPIETTVYPVRFMTAFPKNNFWTVYGATHHDAPDSFPNHLWREIKDGSIRKVEAPFDASGMGIAQLLTVKPVWPGPNGEKYTLPQTPMAWRPHWLRYHKLLAKAAYDDEMYQSLGHRLGKDEKFRQITIHKPDRLFCQYLARLQDKGLLVEDAPRTAADITKREALVTLVDVLVS